VDPGITTGIAIIDAYGNVLNVYSKRDMTRSDIINHILRFGRPIVISSDVEIAPTSVEKIATKLGCVVYSPITSLSIKEKRELTKDYYPSLKNDHEVDALSAAIKAWKHHRPLLSKVNDALIKFDKKEIFADIVLKVLKEENPNIEDAIHEFIEKEKPPVAEEEISKEETAQRDYIERLQKKIIEKQRQSESLKNQNILLSKALNELRKEMRKVEESKLKIDRTEDYQELENSLSYIKKLRGLENKGYYPIIEFEKIDLDLLEKVNDRVDLDSRVILVDVKENLSLLNDQNIKCLLTFDEFDSSGNLEFPVVQIDSNMLEKFDDIKAVKIDYIEKRLADAKKSGLIGWLKGYRKRKD